MMNLDARLAKLEASHKKILRCLWCRYSLREIPATERSTKYTERDALLVKCWTCGTPYYVSLAGQTERQREASKLYYCSHPTKRFNDERVHTALIWLSLSRSEVRRYRAFKQQIRADRLGRQRGASVAQTLHRDLTASQRKQEREREALRTQAHGFDKRRDEQWKQKAKGPESFPIDETLKEIEARYKLENWGVQIKEYARRVGFTDAEIAENHYSRAMSDFKVAAVGCHMHLSSLKKREACEVLLWGGAEPNTLEEIAFFEARLKHLPDIARRALQREAEEQRRKDEERRRKDEEFLQRTRQPSAVVVEQSTPSPAKSAADSDFWHAEAEEELDMQSVLTKYSSMYDKSPVTNVPAPLTDEQGRKRIEIPYIPPEQKPTPPPNDGDPFYHHRMAYFKAHGVWPNNEMLS